MGYTLRIGKEGGIKDNRLKRSDYNIQMKIERSSAVNLTKKWVILWNIKEEMEGSTLEDGIGLNNEGDDDDYYYY